jgi:hypothetical protein
MKHFVFASFCSLAFLAACSDGPAEKVSDTESLQGSTPTETLEASEVEMNGKITISSLPKVFEPNACILPITVTNGTETDATVSMMQFKVSGPGDPDSGNMFGQTVASGGTVTATLIFPTRQCDELLEISAPNITCKTAQGTCEEAVVLKSREGLVLKRAELQPEGN